MLKIFSNSHLPYLSNVMSIASEVSRNDLLRAYFNHPFLKRHREIFFKGKNYRGVEAEKNLKLSPVGVLLLKSYLSEPGMKGRKTRLLPVCLFLGFLVLSDALPPELCNCIYFPSASCSLDSLRQAAHQPAVTDREK